MIHVLFDRHELSSGKDRTILADEQPPYSAVTAFADATLHSSFESEDDVFVIPTSIAKRGQRGMHHHLWPANHGFSTFGIYLDRAYKICDRALGAIP